MRKLVFVGVWVILALALPGSILAQEKKDPYFIVEKSRLVVEEMLGSEDKSLPIDLIMKCSGLAIVPGMVKGGFIVGGSYGEGVVLAHKDGGWTPPAFVYTGAGSLGFQIGAQSIDLLLVIIGEKAMDSFMKSEFRLGADVAVATGPIGAQVTAATDILFRGGILSYSRSKGLFVGVSLEGATMGALPSYNDAYYKGTWNAKDILENKVQAPETAQRLIQVLQRIK